MSKKIDREAYLEYASVLTEEEKGLVEEFGEWLPDEIIDCHAHCNLPEHVLSVSDSTFNHMMSTFPSFTLEESKQWHHLLHPTKTIRSLRFAKTFRGIDHKAANDYLLKRSVEEDRIALYGMYDDPEYTIAMLAHPRVSALKMYFSYVQPPATEIYQYFPKSVLEVAQDLNIPIVLHPPKRITVCLDQILQLVKDFPRLRVCLAHLSLSKSVVPGLEEAFAALAAYPQINFDTALVPSSDQVAMALRIVGSDRIMYGSDEPLHLIRSFPFTHPELGERLATQYPYHWVNYDEHLKYKHLAADATHAHWLSLQAIKEALVQFPKTKKELKQKLFFENAKSFYGF